MPPGAGTEPAAQALQEVAPGLPAMVPGAHGAQLLAPGALANSPAGPGMQVVVAKF